jgi:hypothetical protein
LAQYPEVEVPEVEVLWCGRFEMIWNLACRRIATGFIFNCWDVVLFLGYQ